MQEVSFFAWNGRMTNAVLQMNGLVKNNVLFAVRASGHWSSSEYNQNNAWNVNFNNGNINNNNKYNNNVVRPCAALEEKRKEAWIEAYDDCCRNKKSSDSCIRYRLNYEYDLFQLAHEVETGTYHPSTSICFCVTRPKLREVFAANFRDRIVHHWLMMKLNPLFEQRFVEQGNVSFNCRKGFGTQAAVEQVKQDIFTVSSGYTKPAFVGHFDIVGFFMSIKKNILIRFLKEFVYEHYKGDDIDLVFRTLCIVVQHNPSKDCEVHGKTELFKDLPKNKSLFYVDANSGLPIGNLTSQILANFYLSYFDEVMINWCSERGGKYVRFVDDFVVILPVMKDVFNSFIFARSYLRDNLGITLHDDKKYIQHYSKGLKFVGYVVKYGRIYLSNRTFGHFADRLYKVDRICRSLYESDICYMSDIAELNHQLQALNSYIGFSAHTNNYGMRLKMLLQNKYLLKFVSFKAHTHTIKIINKVKIGKVRYEKDRMERQRMSAALHRKGQRRYETGDYIFRRAQRVA